MKRHLFLLPILALLLSACAQNYPLVAELKPSIAPQPVRYENSTAVLVANDNRTSGAIASYDLDNQQPIEIENIVQVKELIAGQLRDILHSQGLRLEEEATTRLILNVDDLLVKVTRKGLMYEASATTQLRILVVDERHSLEKRYTRNASKLFPLRPAIDQVTTMLDVQIEEVLSTIATDQDINRAIRSR